MVAGGSRLAVGLTGGKLSKALTQHSALAPGLPRRVLRQLWPVHDTTLCRVRLLFLLKQRCHLLHSARWCC